MRATIWTFPALLLLLVSSSSIVACGSNDSDRPPEYFPPGAAGGPGVQTGRCDSGEERECSVTFYQANGAKSCFTGVQYCEDEAWSDCFALEDDPRVE